MITLRASLLKYGCKLSPDEFEEILMDTYAEMYRDLPPERLGNDCKLHLPFCSAVRSRVACPRLPNELILRALTNMRKGGRIGRKDARINRYPVRA